MPGAPSLDVAVRGGGHSFPGHSVCDGLVIDLSLMKGIEVDAEARTARVGAGVLWGELDAATQEHGLATVGGIVTHTGVAGLTLGGGIGWLQRKHGLTIDQLVSADLVTAAGDELTASADQNPELFWGLRGGGGNFGVVTEFEFRLHPVGPTVLAGPVFWPMSESPEVLRFYRDWIRDVPDELMTIVMHRSLPAADFVPSELHGAPVVGITCCYAGDLDEGAEVVRPLREFGTPVLDLCQPKPYLEHQSMFDASFPHGWWYYLRACDVAELSDEVIDITVEYANRIGSPLTAFPIWQLGGAVARVAGRRDGVQRSECRAHLQPQHDLRRPRGIRGGAAVVAGLLRGARAAPDECLRELPLGGGAGAGARGLRRREVRPAPGPQAQIRPGQPVPAEPEHPAIGRPVTASLGLCPGRR